MVLIPALTQEKFRKILKYNPETGIFYWLPRPGLRGRNLNLAGTVAGRHNTNGHIQIRIDGRCYMASHLAYLWQTGEWPEDKVDHRNTVRDDNKWSNLRQATQAQNCRNRNPHKNSASSKKGVYPLPSGKWCAVITVDYKRIYLGSFPNKEQAAAAYTAAAELHHGEFARSK